MTNRNNIICTADGEHIANCTREDAKRLQGKYIQCHRRRGSTWIALECAAVIRAELRRKISPNLPVAEDNYTIRTVSCDGGTYFEFKGKITAAYTAHARLAA